MMTRCLSVLCSGLLVAFAAACGSDGDSGTCGDGHVTGSEACDDGNTANGDGCSASCALETNCGDGTLDVAHEQCDDGNTTNGDGCSSACKKEGTCGNGATEPGETCDDANTKSGDGCNAACSTEPGFTCTGTPSVCSPGSGGGTCAAPGIIMLMPMNTDLVGTAMGDTSSPSATNGVPEAACDGDVAGGGNDQIFKFTTTDTRDVIIQLTPDSAFDGGIRMMTTACDTTTEIIDQIGLDDGCSDTGAAGDPEYLVYVDLPAGTYFVSVDGYTSTDAGPYQLDVIAQMPGCGNGSIGDLEYCDDGNMTDGDGCTHCRVDDNYTCDTSEPSVCKMMGCGDGIIQDNLGEECDDNNMAPNDGCSATCTVETNYSCGGEPSVCKMKGCGNGFIEDTEECDDGNMMSNDRCSSACVLEQDTTEAMEPNNTTPKVLSAGSHIIRASFDQTDVDLYQFTLTAPSRVDIETYSTINGDFTDYTDGFGDNTLFDCLTDNDDTKIALFPMGADTTMDANALKDSTSTKPLINDDHGDQWCSYLGKNDPSQTDMGMLPAGTYIIRVAPSPFAMNLPATRYMLDLKIAPVTTNAVPPAAGDLVINEFLAADGGATNGGVDSNCDGVLSGSDDEFIELVNVSNKLLDLTDVTYSDALGLKFTFAPQATGSLQLAAGKAVVIWGGGAPKCAGVTNFFTNGTKHTMSLNDAGDTITIALGSTTIAQTTYGTATIGTSFNLSPDVTGTTYALHSAVTGHVGNFSPGKKVNGNAF